MTKKKYRIIRTALTDKHGNMHTNQVQKPDGKGGFVMVDVILDEDYWTEDQLKNYLSDGSIELYKPPKTDDGSGGGSKGPTEKEKLSAEYLELAGVESHPKTWTAAKLKEEIGKLQEKKKEAETNGNEEGKDEDKGEGDKTGNQEPPKEDDQGTGGSAEGPEDQV